MIIGSLKNTERYEQLHPLFKKAFEYLKSTDFTNMEVGKIELEGKDLYVAISDSTLKSEAKLEVHNKYIDIQVPISKPETFGLKPRTELKSEFAPFDEVKDIQYFTDSADTMLTLAPNNFIILYPEDGHAPCIGEGKIRKVVVKVKI